jgi:hypothetical protein
VFHIELRQFPHNFCRFNLSEPELRAAVLDAWVRQEPVQLGERSWDPRRASLTVIEAPRLSLQELAMGRGWSNAERRGDDVTKRVLALARAVQGTRAAGTGSGTAAAAPAAAAVAEPAADAASLATELIALLGDDPLSLMRAWRLALERHPDRTPSECLALAEALVRR